ncbi:hypothetical protein [Myroides marinus]|uniref:hypothetical protein n=1 Tax=Myroides marinus TaxID=703342 RepID=UPI002578EC2B|nr:hypothetical protein [Myroides marinus]MDM1379904.1 hypothetical protein [Myroides marinus]MDM1387147.1 hypothetical protein [Myroides marinus]MDM1394360.1 hypothetical protein [Myroides marinus]
MKTHYTTIYTSIFPFLLIGILLTACKSNTHTNRRVADNNKNIVIQGRVLVQGTDSAPLGLTTINIKNKWIWKDESQKAYGENKRVFVDKKGYYKITIEKGDTLMVIPNHIIYGRDVSKYTFANLDKSQTIDIEVNKDEAGYQNLINSNEVLKSNIENLIKNVDPEQLVSVRGTIKSKKTNQPLKNVDISSAFNNNVMGIGTYHLTDQFGNFDLKVPKGNLCSIQALSANAIRFTAQNDTIINLFL